MGLEANSNTHKQDNFFLFFPIYVCLGIYYVLRFFASPFLWIWNKSSDTLSTNLAKYDGTGELRGAYMTEEEKIEAESELSKSFLERSIKNQKEAVISPALIKAREKLISLIDSGEEKRSNK